MSVSNNLSISLFLSFALFCITTDISSNMNAYASWGAEGRGGESHHHHHHHHRRCHGDISSSISSKELFKALFPHQDDNACPATHFYTYHSFINASKSFSGFGTTGNSTTRKLEIAAYLAQISHETSGGWGSAPDGRFSWGLYYIEEVAPHRNYCECIAEWPCYPGKSYKGRGPLQLSWNYKYGPAGKALWFDGLANPEVVASDSVVAFKTALWFWMTEQKPFNEFSYI